MRALQLLIVLALLVPMTALAQNPANFPHRSICDVRTDNDGDCRADAAASADTVCVTGVVIAWKQFGARGAGAIYDPVNGCCLSIFDIDLAPDYPAGTTVTVCGWVGQFNGLDEIIDNPANGSQNPVVTDLQTPGTFPITAITATDMANGSPTAEGLESCAVSLCGHFIDTGNFPAVGSGSNHLFVDAAGDTCVVRVDIDTDIDGTPIPVGDVTVTGVLGQFDANVFCSGYQLQPRSVADFSPGTCTVAVEKQTWGEVKGTYREEED